MIDARDEVHQQTTELLRARLAEAEEMLRAIRHGEIDALVVEGVEGHQVYTLHSADEPYRNLVEQMDEGAVLLTHGGDILYSNARFAALVGKPLESVVGSRMDRFVDLPDRDDFEAMLEAGVGQRRSRLIGPDSATFEVNLSLTTSGSIQGDRLNLIVTDLTGILAADSHRERAERDNRAKDDFLATLGHELRNPLTAIGAAVRLLAVPRSDESATRAREVIARQVGRISRLVDDLLDVERMVSGKVRLNRQPLDLAEAARRVVATFTGDASLDRHIDINSEPLWVDGDIVRIEQVLINILTNAVKYTPAGGRIQVTLRADGNYALITVEDTGVGISAEMLPFIFDMYTQADRTLARARGGLGIGLTLVRRLVELHGGTVDASSDGEGNGSRFSVGLRTITKQNLHSGLAIPGERCLKSRRVLLIEDSVGARETLKMTLELAGHIVYDAADAVRGLQLLNIAHPDVGIIDVSLPAMDGYEVARRLREEPQGQKMLLLALTDHDAPDARLDSLGQAFDYHLVKPVNPDHLARLIGAGATGA